MSSSITTSLLTAGFTALLGLAVFVAGQFALKLFVEPIQAQKRAIGKTAHALTYYANVIEGSDPETVSEGRKVYRDLAAEFRASTNVIPLYRMFARTGPRKYAVLASHLKLPTTTSSGAFSAGGSPPLSLSSRDLIFSRLLPRAPILWRFRG